MIEINNLNNDLFENINLKIKQGEFVFLLGPSGSGKTTLLKMIFGLKDSNIVNDTKNIGIVLDSTSNLFITDTVKEEISINLKNKEDLDEIVKYFKIENLLDLTPTNLSGGEQQLISLLSVLLSKPDIILIDDALSMLDGITKEKVYKYLKKLNTKEKTTIICTTQDTNDILYGKRVVIINKKIELDEKIKKSFNEKTFKNSLLELPFMVSLSIKLKYYDLLDNIITDIDKMVNTLWK